MPVRVEYVNYTNSRESGESFLVRYATLVLVYVQWHVLDLVGAPKSVECDERKLCRII